MKKTTVLSAAKYGILVGLLLLCFVPVLIMIVLRTVTGSDWGAASIALSAAAFAAGQFFGGRLQGR